MILWMMACIIFQNSNLNKFSYEVFRVKLWEVLKCFVLSALQLSLGLNDVYKRQYERLKIIF